MTLITYRSTHRFPEKTEDDTNITVTYRGITSYFEIFDKRLPEGMRLQEFVNSRPLSCGRKIKVLDSGAGEGYAMHTLLESEFGKSIKQVTGISLHAFKVVLDILEMHKSRVKWYLGDAATVMKKLPTEYDLVIDLWGAYSYSKERVDLIKRIHRILLDGGRAYIFFAAENLLYKKSKCIEQKLAAKHPETFQFYKDDYRVFVIKKSSPRCPSFNFAIKREEWGCSFQEKRKQYAKRGNSWYPKKLEFVPVPEERPLRSLSGEAPLKRPRSIDKPSDAGRGDNVP